MLVKLFPWWFMRPMIGVISLIFINSNILVCGLAIHLVWLCQRLGLGSSDWARHTLDTLYRGWVKACNWWFKNMLGMHWQLDAQIDKTPEKWRLVIANHQTWVDAFVLLAQVQGHMPMPRIFMKDTLSWLPLVGSATKIMGFPQVKRYSQATLKKRPELVGRDLETTRRSCFYLNQAPSTLMSFVEGTRFTATKKAKQQSPYECLLKPKAGGVFMALRAMPGRFNSITDLNIIYPDGKPSYWDLVCGNVGRVEVRVREVPIPARFTHSAIAEDKADFYEWFNGYWQAKDRTLVADQLDCSILEMSQKDPIDRAIVSRMK
ncbi:acyltransferase [Marinomonas piezotolerans]|uniref:Acyltransferase n=1 Tax=Marinomonas piezotolerans TaxID=2213058 RepID=A0A370U8Z5_9GAMM|nr:acetyltransferase [Marinomonas piezotolerans]RDL44235.1 acyltransferase [Marinomonas piezotolerans]